QETSRRIAPRGASWRGSKSVPKNNSSPPNRAPTSWMKAIISSSDFSASSRRSAPRTLLYRLLTIPVALVIFASALGEIDGRRRQPQRALSYELRVHVMRTPAPHLCRSLVPAIVPHPDRLPSGRNTCR